MWRFATRIPAGERPFLSFGRVGLAYCCVVTAAAACNRVPLGVAAAAGREPQRICRRAGPYTPRPVVRSSALSAAPRGLSGQVEAACHAQLMERRAPHTTPWTQSAEAPPRARLPRAWLPSSHVHMREKGPVVSPPVSGTQPPQQRCACGPHRHTGLAAPGSSPPHNRRPRVRPGQAGAALLACRRTQHPARADAALQGPRDARGGYRDTTLAPSPLACRWAPAATLLALLPRGIIPLAHSSAFPAV